MGQWERKGKVSTTKVESSDWTSQPTEASSVNEFSLFGLHKENLDNFPPDSHVFFDSGFLNACKCGDRWEKLGFFLPFSLFFSLFETGSCDEDR